MPDACLQVDAEVATPPHDRRDRGRATSGRRARVRHGLRRPHNWLQLVRFSIVGASGYVINLAVYSRSSTAADLHYLPAAVLAFCVAVTNNFL